MEPSPTPEVERRRRREVESALGAPMQDFAWVLMVERGALDDMRAGVTADEIARQYREIADAFRPAQRSARDEGDPLAGAEGSLLGAQLHAVAVLFAQEAEADDEVAGFRRQRLGDSLLDHEQVEPWIRELGRVEPSDTLIEFVRPPDTKIVSNAEGFAANPPIVIAEGIRYLKVSPAPQLDYTVPSDDWVHRVPVQMGGVLDELRELASRLSMRYGWQPAHAATFVLTGLAPPRPSVRVGRQVGTLPAASRFELSIDLAVTPAELASRYRALRAELLPRGPRAISRRHSVLVAFVASRPAQETWRTRMDAWNGLWGSRQPEWWYSEVSNFHRDYGKSRRRLLEGT